MWSIVSVGRPVSATRLYPAPSRPSSRYCGVVEKFLARSANGMKFGSCRATIGSRFREVEEKRASGGEGDGIECGV